MFDLAPTLPGTIGAVSVPGSAAVIGDIHGRADLLRRLLKQLPAGIPIFVVGDICDRGPDTRACIDLLVEAGARGVRGNHDEWLLTWASGGRLDPAAMSPLMRGRPTLASYGVVGDTLKEMEPQRDKVPEAHRRWLASLNTAFNLQVGREPFWLIHAGIPSTVALPTMSLPEVVPHLVAHHPATLLWASNDPREMLPVDRPVVMGHVPQKRPVNLPHVLAIDTGAGTIQGGALTAVVLPERRFVTVG